MIGNSTSGPEMTGTSSHLYSAQPYRSVSPASSDGRSSQLSDHSYTRPSRYSREEVTSSNRTNHTSNEESSSFGTNQGRVVRRSSARDDKDVEADHEQLAAWRRRVGRTDPNRLDSSSSTGTSRTDPASETEDPEDGLPAWRRRVNRPDPASSGVYLHKRRSREEKGLSKDDIEASLNSADSYWQQKFKHLPETSEAVDQRNTMTDSTYSSGSGEEMARSESGHNLTTPTSPPLSPHAESKDLKRRSWGSSPRAVSPQPASKRSSRNSDIIDDRLAEEIVQQALVDKRNSRNSDILESAPDLDDLTHPHRYSAGSDLTKFVEKGEEIAGYNSSHSSEDSHPFSRSSSEQSVVQKRMSYTQEDHQEHNVLDGKSSIGPGSHGAPPPYHATPGYSQNIPSPPPYTSPNSTERYGVGLEDPRGEKSLVSSGHIAPSEGDGVASSKQSTVGNLQADLGIKKTPSPNESIESMTLSEQDALLSKA